MVWEKRLYGDTYPHYWSDLTAHAYRECAELFGSEEYVYKAEAAYRGVLSMFRADGSAACAYVYPVTVNGVEGGYYDVYAMIRIGDCIFICVPILSG